MGSLFFFIQINPNFSRQYLESHKHLFPYASKVTEPFLKIFSFPAVITNDKEFEAYSFGSFFADCGGSFVCLWVKKVQKVQTLEALL